MQPYFRALQIRLRRGRFFTDRDGVAGQPVAIVNEAFAAKYWPGKDPLGKRLRRVSTSEAQPWLTVIGVIPDLPQSFGRPLQRDPLVYLPIAAVPEGFVTVIARTAVPPGTLVEPFRRALQSVDENLPAQGVISLDDLLVMQRGNVTFFGMLFTIFAAIALVLASVGLYAVMAHAVGRRAQEIGIRVAMGARREDILALVFSQSMRQVAMGLAAGLPLAFAVTRVLQGVLVGVSPGDPLTLLSVLIVLGVAGLLGCGVPAVRALHVDPLIALRSE
jgi:predicted lysophospholipase L1 biosynthesis ABC-type transport system permease subunit